MKTKAPPLTLLSIFVFFISFSALANKSDDPQKVLSDYFGKYANPQRIQFLQAQEYGSWYVPSSSAGSYSFLPRIISKEDEIPFDIHPYRTSFLYYSRRSIPLILGDATSQRFCHLRSKEKFTIGTNESYELKLYSVDGIRVVEENLSKVVAKLKEQKGNFFYAFLVEHSTIKGKEFFISCRESTMTTLGKPKFKSFASRFLTVLE